VSAWERLLALGKYVGQLGAAPGQARASDRYQLYQARAAAVGKEPWMTEWTGPVPADSRRSAGFKLDTRRPMVPAPVLVQNGVRSC
jgi:hypothetical protein